MKKIYALLCFIVSANALFAQCAILNGAFVNSCGANEGLNELVVFTTTTQTTVADYVFGYGSVNPPAGNSPSGILPGANARSQNGPGIITAIGGCTKVDVTTNTTVIPAQSTVVFIPSNFDNNFNVSAFCQTGTVYVVYIDITKAPSVWSANGTLVNNPINVRYLQVSNGQNSCTSFVRSYTAGWPANTNGNIVSWNITGEATYINLGCDLITTPVSLLSFTAVGHGKNANIMWQTSSEVNTKSFELQRSTDAANFNTIYSTPAAGHSSSVKSYAFTDLTISAGPIYYRLKMIDNDGSNTYSKVAKVASTGNGFVISNLYPSPAVSQLRITWNAATASNTLASVYDLAGRILVSETVAGIAGMNYYQLPVSQLPTGAYLLKLVKDGETIVSRFTKQ